MKPKVTALSALVIHFAIFFGNAAVSAQQLGHVGKVGTGIRARRALRQHLHWHHDPVIRPVLRPATTIAAPVLFAMPTLTATQPVQNMIAAPGQSNSGLSTAMPGWAVYAKSQRFVPTTGTQTSALFFTAGLH